jgi:hypothetical protein
MIVAKLIARAAERALFQQFLQNPNNIKGIQRQLENAGAKAHK